MVMSENIGSVNWPIGIVTEVFTQDNRLVRDVTVKTSKDLFRRDVRKLCLLEGADDSGSPNFSYVCKLGYYFV